MSGLIKAGAAEALLRRVGEGAHPSLIMTSAQAPDPAILLEARIAELEEERASLNAAMPARIEAAYKEGLEAGLKEKDDASDKRLALLKDAAERAQSSWDDRLGSTGRLAILVARAAFAKIIGNPDWRSELVVGAIERRISALGKGTIVSVRVSGQDFSADEIVALGIGAGAKVEATETLGPGECSVELAMGHEVIGPEAQWERLARLLDELAEAAC